MSKTQPFGADKCPNCGEYGSHYCGPSFGDKGFFTCEKKTKKEKGNIMKKEKDVLLIDKFIEDLSKILHKEAESQRRLQGDGYDSDTATYDAVYYIVESMLTDIAEALTKYLREIKNKQV